jgi:hypothetical protein
MHKFMYNRMVFNANMGGSSGGASSGQQSTGQQQQQTPNQQGNAGGQTVQDDPNKVLTPAEALAQFQSLWDTTPPPAPGGGNQGGNQGGQQGTQGGQQGNQGTQQPDRLSGYLKEQDYFAGVDKNKLMQAAQQGDSETFVGMLGDVFRNFHSIALANMDKFGQHYANKAKNEAMNDFGSSYRMDKMYENMFEAKAELRLPAVAPMAKATLKQFLNKGEKPEDAIKKTVALFDALGGAFGKPPANIGNSGGRPTGNGMMQDIQNPSVGFRVDNGQTKAMDYDALWSQP